MLRRLLALLLVAVIVLSACSGDDDDASSDGTLPQPSEADLETADVSGPWTVTITIDAQTEPVLGASLAGDVLERQFVFGNGCNADGSDCRVIRESAVGPSEETWTRQGAVLTYHVEQPVLAPCADEDGEETEVEHLVSATITMTVTDAILLGDGWSATAMDYAREAEVTPIVEGCPTGTQTESGAGEPGAPVPDTTVPGTDVSDTTVPDTTVP